jgi:hypothetical protein
MSLGKLILAEVRHSARRAHRHFRAGEADEGRRLARRIATLLASLRERYDTDSAPPPTGARSPEARSAGGLRRGPLRA